MLPGHLGKQPLHLVDPGRIGRGEMHMKPEMLSQAGVAGRMLVCCVVVTDTCTSRPWGTVGTVLSILTRNFLNSTARCRRWNGEITVPSLNVEGRKQARRAVPNIILRARLKGCRAALLTSAGSVIRLGPDFSHLPITPPRILVGSECLPATRGSHCPVLIPECR